MSLCARTRTLVERYATSAFPPQSGHQITVRPCPLCARSGHRLVTRPGSEETEGEARFLLLLRRVFDCQIHQYHSK
jgi:hypothetical protein